MREHDHERLEYLCRYVLRPPLAQDRVKLLGPSTVCLELRRPWADRTTHVSMPASTFLARLASLIPRPRANTTLTSGVLAGHARGRHTLVPKGPPRPRRLDASWAASMKHSLWVSTFSPARGAGAG